MMRYHHCRMRQEYAGCNYGYGTAEQAIYMMYGGTVKKGKWNNRNLDIVSAFEAYGQRIKGNISDFDYKGIIKHSIPGAGACGGMYTANTMASAIECMGMSIPFSSSNPAVGHHKQDEARRVADAIKIILEKDLKPKDIMTEMHLKMPSPLSWFLEVQQML
jgi:dihydroxy-acid dehydratase